MVADAIDIERLIGEVARRHKLLLDRDDPILMTVTLNELLLAASLSRLDQVLQNAEARATASSVQHAEVMKDVATRLITASAVYADKEIRAAANFAATQIITAMADQLSLLKEIMPVPRKAVSRSIATWTTILAGASVLSAAIVVYYVWSLPSPSTCLSRAKDEAAIARR